MAGSTAYSSGYLEHKPSYDRATFDRIRLALATPEPIRHRRGRGLVEAGGIQTEADPLGCRWLRWIPRGCDGLPINREPRFRSLLVPFSNSVGWVLSF
jgi:hypothetical protein